MDFLKFCLPFFVGLAILAGVLIFGCEKYAEYQCESYERLTGKRTKYNKFDICYVENNGAFERWDAYKMKVAAENLK